MKKLNAIAIFLIFYTSIIMSAELTADEANDQQLPILTSVEANKNDSKNFYKFEDLNITTAPSGDFVRSIYLKKINDKWSWIDQSDWNVLDENSELIILTSTGNISLGSKGKSPECLPGKCLCMKGLLGYSRRSNGYYLCTSNFKKAATDGRSVASTAINAVGAIGALFSGTVVYFHELDKEALELALKEANVVGKLNDEYYKEYLRNYSNSLNSDAISLFLNKYKGKYDPDGYVSVVEQRLFALNKQKQFDTYKEKFSSSKSSAEWNSFIIEYHSNDPDGLIPKAKERLAFALKEEEKKQKQDDKDRANRKEEERKQEVARQAKIDAWRKSLKVGDDTFCGPVIELRQPMVRIALKVQLSGYPNETWLKSSDLYPDWIAGCRNINGRLHPIF